MHGDYADRDELREPVHLLLASDRILRHARDARGASGRARCHCQSADGRAEKADKWLLRPRQERQEKAGRIAAAGALRHFAVRRAHDVPKATAADKVPKVTQGDQVHIPCHKRAGAGHAEEAGGRRRAADPDLPVDQRVEQKDVSPNQQADAQGRVGAVVGEPAVPSHRRHEDCAPHDS